MTVSFVAASPTVFVASGASTLTVARPAGTRTGDVMLACVFSRFGQFARTSPLGASFGSFFVATVDRTHWITRADNQTLLYRVVRDDEPSTYTFEFSQSLSALYGDITDHYLVGTVVAYRGADINPPVGSDDLLTFYGSGEPIIFEEPGHDWDGSIVGYGYQFDGYAGIQSSQATPFYSPYWFTAVQDQLTIVVVSVDWSGPSVTGVGALTPDPPTNVAITLPAGFTRRTGADNAHGGLVTIADGPAFSNPAYGSPGALIGTGTWRDKTFDLYEYARYQLASPELDVPDQVVGGATFRMQANVWVMAVYAGDGCPPRLTATARTTNERVRAQ